MWSFIFPGQGSQASGMGKFLYENFPVAKQTFEEASDAISFDLKKLCFEGSDSDLALTENTQPALLTTSIASQRVLSSLASIRPIAAIGHSIGEYAAVVSAGSLQFAPAVRSVRKRGKAMQSAVPVGEGAMAAVMGLDENQVKVLCNMVQIATGKILEPANYNSPGQIVISGHAEAMTWLKENFKPEALPGEPKRAKLIPLNVSAPFHCSLMKPAEKEMRRFLAEIEFTDGMFPVVQNFTATAENQGIVIRENLISQISGPVRWIECTEKLVQLGTQKTIELGHGKVASGLVKKIAGGLETYNFNSLDDIKLIETAIKG